MTKPNQKPPITKIVEGRAKRLLGEFGRPDLIVDGEKEEQGGGGGSGRWRSATR